MLTTQFNELVSALKNSLCLILYITSANYSLNCSFANSLYDFPILHQHLYAAVDADFFTAQ